MRRLDKTFRGRGRAVAMAGVVLAAVSVSGCGSSAAYKDLESAMKDGITKNNDRPVRSVDCSPGLKTVASGQTAHLKCTVRFINAKSYVAGATIQGQASGDKYSWDAPPAS